MPWLWVLTHGLLRKILLMTTHGKKSFVKHHFRRKCSKFLAIISEVLLLFNNRKENIKKCLDSIHRSSLQVWNILTHLQIFQITFYLFFAYWWTLTLWIRLLIIRFMTSSILKQIRRRKPACLRGKANTPVILNIFSQNNVIFHRLEKHYPKSLAEMTLIH